MIAVAILVAGAAALGRAGGAKGPLIIPVLAPVASTNAQPRADRPLLWLSGSLVPQTATVFGSSGTVVGTVASAAGVYSSLWADASRHLCVLRNLPGRQGLVTAAELDIVDAGNGARRVVTAASGLAPGPLPAKGFPSWSAVACSVIADRAVLTEGGTNGVGGLAVVQLSTGRVLYSRVDQPSAAAPELFPVNVLTASADGGLAVEELRGGSIRLRDLSSGAVTPWPGGPRNQPASVSSLSWHGLRAVTDRGVVDLGNGRTTWRPLLATPMSPEQDARPGGDDVVVTVGDNEVVVRSDGSAIWLWAAFQPLGLPCSQLSYVLPLDRVIILC